MVPVAPGSAHVRAIVERPSPARRRSDRSGPASCRSGSLLPNWLSSDVAVPSGSFCNLLRISGHTHSKGFFQVRPSRLLAGSFGWVGPTSPKRQESGSFAGNCLRSSWQGPPTGWPVAKVPKSGYPGRIRCKRFTGSNSIRCPRSASSPFVRGEIRVAGLDGISLTARTSRYMDRLFCCLVVMAQRHPGWNWPHKGCPKPVMPWETRSRSCHGRAERRDDRIPPQKNRVGPGDGPCVGRGASPAATSGADPTALARSYPGGMAAAGPRGHAMAQG